ncbi:MAG TPA: helicase-associated domain-containing protein, partial [Ktedonosporobacter sp.]|nr:helicase-associated domain-containing protein [Ktedonosporobacter sp.]
HLLVLGLLFWGKQTNFAGREYTSGIHDGVLIVPLEVRNVVRSALETEEKPSPPAHADIEEGARALQRSLYLYWSLVASLREGLAIQNNGLLARASLRLVVERVSNKGQPEQVRVESDMPHLLFLRLLLLKLGLLQERRHHTLYAAPAEAFFALPLLERARLCYRLYLETPFWNEIPYLPEVIVRPGPAPLDPAHEEVMHARQIVAGRLSHEQIGEWRGLAVLVARSKLYAPYLLFPRQSGPRGERYSSSSNPYGWDFRLRRGWLTHREGWHMVEGGFIRAVVTGPLYWLGLVEIDHAENPSAFRVSPGAAQIMSQEPVPDGNTLGGRLLVQSNFELVALPPVSEALLVRLDRFADRVNLAEHTAQYRLTKASVTRAIQAGLHADTIQQELERAADGEIPQNVRYSLQEWERQARRVEVWRSATVLEVDDAALLDTLFANEETRQFFHRRLAPTLAEVALQQLPAVQNILWQRDYLPTTIKTQDVSLENGRLVEREAQWRLHEDGLLQPFSAVLDLYLAAEAERFSVVDEVTGWRRITPTSLQQAFASGLSLDQIVRFLQHYCERGIPGSFLIRLKLWGGGYGETTHIAVEEAPMLRLPAQVLRDLQSDEELSLLLGQEVEPSSRLVRVEAANLEQVQALLRERGFQVE